MRCRSPAHGPLHLTFVDCMTRGSPVWRGLRRNCVWRLYALRDALRMQKQKRHIVSPSRMWGAEENVFADQAESADVRLCSYISVCCV